MALGKPGHHSSALLRPEWNSQHSADDNFKCMFFKDFFFYLYIFIQISVMFVSESVIDNKLTLI